LPLATDFFIFDFSIFPTGRKVVRAQTSSQLCLLKDILYLDNKLTQGLGQLLARVTIFSCSRILPASVVL
jgi:hypothetical protein